jgi:hypothetical protein
MTIILAERRNPALLCQWPERTGRRQVVARSNRTRKTPPNHAATSSAVSVYELPMIAMGLYDGSDLDLGNMLIALFVNGHYLGVPACGDCLCCLHRLLNLIVVEDTSSID